MDCYILVVIIWEGLGGFAGQGVGLVSDVRLTILGISFICVNKGFFYGSRDHTIQNDQDEQEGRRKLQPEGSTDLSLLSRGELALQEGKDVQHRGL